MRHDITNITNNIYQYLTKFRVATRRQILTLCGDTAATEEAIQGMINLRRVGQRKLQIRRGKYADVLYLKAASRIPAAAANPKIAHLIRIGLPPKNLFNRLYHELLVVETLCWYKTRTDVFDFYVEDELKSRGANPADLQIHFCHRNGDLSYADCEVVVQNTAKQIAAKSRDMVFFTPNQTRADRIEHDKKCAAVVLDIEYNQVEDSYITDDDDPIYDQCRNLFCSNAIALTAGALGVITGNDRARVAASMSRNTRPGQRATVRIDLDTSGGRPETLYGFICDFESYSSRIFYLFLSRLIEKAAEGAAMLKDFRLGVRTILFEKAGQKHLFYIDDPLVNLVDSIEKYALIWGDDELKQGITTYFIPANSARYFETLEIMEDIRLADLILARDFKF